MKTYNGKELDEKISTFLAKKTQRFPELKRIQRPAKADKYENGLFSRLEKASTMWSRYVHA